MNGRVLAMLVVLVLMAGIVALNWTALLTQATLSIGIASVSAPVGLLLLGFVILLTALFLVIVLYMQTAIFREGRQHARELQAQRDLAEQAEASRLAELRQYLEAESQRGALRDEEFKTALLARLDRLEAELRAAVENSGNTMGAYIGELEQRLEQRAGRERPEAG